MKLHIYIPTYRRIERQKTLAGLPPQVMKNTTLVCDEKDYRGGLRKLAKRVGCDTLLVPAKIKTIAQKRAWLLKTTKHRKILMLDDDLKFCRRAYSDKANLKFKLVQATPKRVLKALRKIDKLLEDYAHVGISARQGNNTVLVRGSAINRRMIYALGYNVRIIRKICKLGRIEHREDMDYCLQLLRAGYENRVLVDLCVDQVYNAPGGAREERTVEASNDDAEKLAWLHPGLVKVVDKDYKSSTPRKEVICYWKKAFESSQEK